MQQLKESIRDLESRKADLKERLDKMGKAVEVASKECQSSLNSLDIR